MEDSEIAQISHIVMAEYVSNPTQLGSQGWTNGMEPSFIPFLSTPTEDVLEVVSPDGRQRSISLLQQYSTQECEPLSLRDAVSLQLCCKWLEYDSNTSMSEILDQVWSSADQSLIALLVQILEITVSTLFKGIIPSESDSDACSTELLTQLLRLSSQLCDLIRSYLPSDPLEARLAKRYFTVTVGLRIVAGVISDCRRNEEPLSEALEGALGKAAKALKAMINHVGWDYTPLLQALEETQSALPEDAFVLATQPVRVFDLFRTLLDDSDEESEKIQSIQGIAAVRDRLFVLLSTMHVSEQLALVGCLSRRDNGRVGIRDWYLQQVVFTLDATLSRLAGYTSASNNSAPSLDDDLKIELLQHSIVKSLAFLDGSVECSSDGIHNDNVVEDVTQFLVSENAMGSIIQRCYKVMLDYDISTYSTFTLAEHLLPIAKGTPLFVPFLLTLLRSLRLQPPPVVFSDQLQLLVMHVVEDDSLSDGDLARLRSELGYVLKEMADDETMVHWGDPTAAAGYVVQLLEYLRDRALSAVQDVQMEEDVEDLSRIALEGLSESSFGVLAELADSVMAIDSKPLSSFATYMSWSNATSSLNQPLQDTHDISTTTRTLMATLQDGAKSPRPSTPTPSTPPSILGMGE